MILKNIMEKLKTVLSLVLAAITGKSILFHAIMENGAIFYRLPISRLFREDMSQRKFQRDALTSFSFWNCFLIILLSLLGIF